MEYLIKKTPDKFIKTVNDEIHSILSRNFDNLFPEYVFEQEMKGMVVPVDIKEFEDKYVVRAEIPGIKKEDIKLDIKKNSLKIEATKSIENEEEDKKKKYHKTEFRYGEYSRTLYFPEDVDIENCDAALDHGILTINLQKALKEEEKCCKIEIKE